MPAIGIVAVLAYELGALVTFIKLTFFDGYIYNAWNWIVTLPINMFLSQMWPLYWMVLRSIFG
jgi:hypothetical protein